MMADSPRQLTFDLPHRSAMGRDDFIVSPANQAAMDAVDRWPDWPHHALVLLGAPGSGKSHLAAVWRQISNAVLVEALTLDEHNLAPLAEGGCMIVERANAGFANETALFHALNLAREYAASILFTSTVPTADWPVKLPDLRSRLLAIPSVRLTAPDDLLLRAVLGKLFADRQIIVDAHIVNYILPRMHRSLDAARQLVDAIDRLALAERRNITRALVQRVLRQDVITEANSNG